MGDRVTTYNDCPKCGSDGTFECYEALSSNIKYDECTNCGYHINYDVEETEDAIKITPRPSEVLKPQQPKAAPTHTNTIDNEAELRKELWWIFSHLTDKDDGRGTVNYFFDDLIPYIQQREAAINKTIMESLPEPKPFSDKNTVHTQVAVLAYNQALEDVREALTKKYGRADNE